MFVFYPDCHTCLVKQKCYSTVSPNCQSARGHSNKTKQNFSMTGFPNASSRASTGTNDEEARYTLPFRLALSMGGVAIGNVSHANHVKFNWVAGCDPI